MNKGVTYEQIREICREKWAIARSSDYDFNADNYTWVFGMNIWGPLFRAMTVYSCMPVENDGTEITKYMGVPVEWSHDHPDKIALYKEIK